MWGCRCWFMSEVSRAKFKRCNSLCWTLVVYLFCWSYREEEHYHIISGYQRYANVYHHREVITIIAVVYILYVDGSDVSDDILLIFGPSENFFQGSSDHRLRTLLRCPVDSWFPGGPTQRSCTMFRGNPQSGLRLEDLNCRSHEMKWTRLFSNLSNLRSGICKKW